MWGKRQEEEDRGEEGGGESWMSCLPRGSVGVVVSGGWGLWLLLGDSSRREEVHCWQLLLLIA